ncbi:MAG: hypothetical protein K0R90_266 [Oscillospiraceae bacterium]|jgi:ribosomal protein L40E|nr:hypothetical protein [Oscillospiraceae bacterium]
MGMFDDILGKAKDVADVAGKKTGEFVETSKLKFQCVQINNEIKALYEKLGSAVYSMAKSGYENPELVKSIVDEISELLQKLNETSEKIADIKNVSICTCCGAKNSTESYYCSKCGNKISSEFSKEYEDMASKAEEHSPENDEGKDI